MNLFPIRWWQRWIDYVNHDQPNNPNDASSVSEHCDSPGSSALKRPAGIDNSDLIYDAASEDTNSGIEIHDTLLEGRDYVLLPHEVWNRLHTWYGNVMPFFVNPTTMEIQIHSSVFIYVHTYLLGFYIVKGNPE